MNLTQWLFWVIPETLKYIIISYGILGYELKKGFHKYFIFLYLFVGILFVNYLNIDSLYYQSLWYPIFVIAFFQGKLGEKIKLFLIDIILIDIVDICIWSITINLIHNQNLYKTLAMDFSDTISVVLWLIIAQLMKKKKRKIQQFLNQFSFVYFILLCILFICLLFIAGSIQYLAIEGTSEHLKKLAIMANMISTVIILMISVIFMYLIYSKNKIKLINQLNEERITYQKHYYEKILKSDDTMRSFRHDIKNHLMALQTLCKKNNNTEINQYLSQFHTLIQENSTVNTGNDIANYLISATIDEFSHENDFEYYIYGNFPEHLKITNHDLCILLGNALDNAKEELFQIDGRKILEIHIKVLHNSLFIVIKNTARTLNKPLLTTEKENKSLHGFGTKNMQAIIDKYHGNISWKCENGMFCVEMDLY